MIIEFSGLPGSGKSSVIRELFGTLATSDIELVPVHKTGVLSSTLAETMHNPLVRAFPGRALMMQGIKFRRRYEDFVAAALGASPEVSEDDEFMIHLLGARFVQASDPEFARKLVLFDEGFFLRGTAMFFRLGTAGLSDYLTHMPRPDVLVHVSVPPDVAYERCVGRRPEVLHDRRVGAVHGKFGDAEAFRRRNRLMEHGLAMVRKQGVRVIDIENSADLSLSVAIAADALQAAWMSNEVSRAMINTGNRINVG